MIIGIGGVSRAGKSTLAEEIKALFPNLKVTILCQDDFAVERCQMTMIHNHLNWEIPSCYDNTRFIQAIREANKNSDIVIVEGILVFIDEIQDYFDKRIFLRISKQTFEYYKRLDTRWGVEPEWYIQYIWEAHNKYGIPELDNSFLVLQNDEGHNIETVKEYLNE